MSIQAKEFVFIMLKPAAVSNKSLNKVIKDRLSNFGQIKYFKGSVLANKEIIAEHYKASKSSFWYPLVIHYLNNKLVECFILESKLDAEYLSNYRKCSFADFLRKQVIGPANVFKTKKSHLRRLGLRIFSGFFLDNLVHCSDTTKEALNEIRIWYKDQPNIIEEFEKKALVIK